MALYGAEELHFDKFCVNWTQEPNVIFMPENKILLLSKCVERRYAEMLFYEGVLHFGYPSEWIKKAEEGNVGQGDLLEGVYTNENRFWNFFRRWFPRLVRDKENGTKYLRKHPVNHVFPA